MAGSGRTEDIAQEDLFYSLVDQNGLWLQEYLNNHLGYDGGFRVFTDKRKKRGQDYPSAVLRLFELGGDWEKPLEDEPSLVVGARVNHYHSIERWVEDIDSARKELEYPVEYFLNEEWRDTPEEIRNNYKLRTPNPPSWEPTSAT